jgi:hypothetical protein
MSVDEPFGHPPEGDDPLAVDPLLPPELRPEPSGGGAEAGVDDAGSRIPHRYRSSLAASALAAGMIGLRDVLEDPKDRRPVIEQFADEGDPDRPVRVRLDPDEPGVGVVHLRER